MVVTGRGVVVGVTTDARVGVVTGATGVVTFAGVVTGVGVVVVATVVEPSVV
jgi:hypothetical protein